MAADPSRLSLLVGGTAMKAAVRQFPFLPDALRRQALPYKLGDVRSNGRRAKQPLNARGKIGSAYDPANWQPIASAYRAVRAGRASGVGVCLTDGVGVVVADLDDSIRDGQLTPAARRIVEALGSLVELSPSGTGVHVWTFAQPPEYANNSTIIHADEQKIELIRKGYITITGKLLPGFPTKIHNAQDAVDSLYALRESGGTGTGRTQGVVEKFVADRATLPSVADVVERLETRSDLRIRQLWDADLSDFERSASEADWSLLREIIYFTGPDEDLALEVFQESPLSYRDKSQNRIESYVMPSIHKIIGKRLESGVAFFDWGQL
jgi:primase-polymerase (primpol)-like protein